MQRLERTTHTSASDANAGYYAAFLALTFGLINPDQPLTITAVIQGDADCTASTQLDRLEVRILQIK